MYIRSMEGEWMGRKWSESSNSQGTLGAWVLKKNEKKRLFIPSFHDIYNNIQFRDNLKLWAVSIRVQVPCLPFIHTFSAMIYKMAINSKY